MSKRSKKLYRLRWLIILLIAIFGRWCSQSDLYERMQALEFGSSTQRMGLRWRDRLRNVWRFRWLRLKSDD